MSDLSVFSDDDIIRILDSEGETELRNRGFRYGWYKTEPFVGAIYILVNPAFPNLVKIGYADDVQSRLRILNRNSGLPDPFHCFAIYHVKKRLEDLKLHSLIDTLDPSLRHSRNREFYEMDCQKAFDILSAIAQINGDEAQLTVNPFSDEFFENSQDNHTSELGEHTERTQKKSKMKFSMIGVPVGSTLVFVNDHSITCTTLDDVNKVEFHGETYSISTLAAKLLNVSSAQGGRFFMYSGEVLTHIRERLGI